MLTNLLEHLKGKDIWWGICVLLLLGTFIFMAIFCLVTGKKPDNVEMLTVALLALLNQLMGFRYGSSKGSKDKDKTSPRPSPKGEGGETSPQPSPKGEGGEL